MSRIAALAAGLLLTTALAAEAEPLKIGFITTLSTPAGYLGEDARDGFALAIEEGGGALGGVEVELLVEDDNLKPGNGRQIAEKFLQAEDVTLFTGIIFSNVLGAALPAILENDGIYVSVNAAPSIFAGARCDADYYVASWQNDSLHESAGALANKLGYERMVILAPNYQAGRDALTGFKRLFEGEIVDEIYTSLDQSDFSAELARIRDAAPDAVFQFHPGGAGIAFIKQYEAAGLKEQIPMVLAAPSLEQRIIGAVGEAADGMRVTMHWNTDYDNETSQSFVAAYEEAYGRTPTIYAAQGYDAALLIGSALEAVGGDLGDHEAFRTAMLKADVALTRGDFAFANNQHPVQDWWEVVAEAGEDGQMRLVTKERVLEQHGDAYAADCPL